MDRASRRIVGCFFGQRDALGAFGLWQSLPTPSLDAVCHTDRLSAYKGSSSGPCIVSVEHNTSNASMPP